MTAPDNANTTPAELPGGLQAEILSSGTITLDALKLRLAATVAPRRWRSRLQQLAQRIDGGEPLEQAVTRTQMPQALSGLMREAVQLPDPAQFVLDTMQAREEVQSTWRAFIALVSYPLLLLLFATFIGAAFSMSIRGMVDFSELEDFGLRGFAEVKANIEDQHAALLGMAIAMGWVALVMLTIAVVGPEWALSAVLGGFLIIGRPLRWLSLQEILYRYYLFVEQGISDSSLGERVARSFGNSSGAIVAASIARRVQAGTPLGRSLAMSMYADGLCRPTLQLLDEQNERLPQACLRAARLLGALAEQRCHVLSMVVPVFLLAVVGTILWATISCYIMVFFPLVNMISAMS
ncbi:MAG: type II secretion system F family protein [Pirellulaceae bacterium]